MAPDGISLLFAQDKWAVAPLLRGLEPDVVLCSGFPWKLPQEALDVARLGSVNQHPGKLPRHRGPVPMAWALRDGDAEFGITWHRMDAELDTGPTLAQTTVPIEDDDTTIEQIGPKLTMALLGAPATGLRAPRGRGSRRPAERRGSHLGRALRRGLRDCRLGAAGPQDPRPGARMAAHIRPVQGGRADRRARRQASQAPAHEPHRPGQRRAGRPVRRGDPLDRRVRARRVGLSRRPPRT